MKNLFFEVFYINLGTERNILPCVTGLVLGAIQRSCGSRKNIGPSPIQPGPAQPSPHASTPVLSALKAHAVVGGRGGGGRGAWHGVWPGFARRGAAQRA